MMVYLKAVGVHVWGGGGYMYGGGADEGIMDVRRLLPSYGTDFERVISLRNNRIRMCRLYGDKL